MQVTLAALAEAANTTDSGNLNILGIFNEVRATRFPTRHPSCVLVIQLRVRPSETGRPITLTVKLMDDDRVLTEVEGEIMIPEQANVRLDTTVNQLFKLQMLPLERAGSYGLPRIRVRGARGGEAHQVLAPHPPPPVDDGTKECAPIQGVC